MDSDRLVYRILEAAHQVHTALGPGFVESVYGRALTAELSTNGFQIDREKAIKIWYGPRIVGKHRFDLLIDSAGIVELKASRSIIPLHLAQMRSYLHASSYPFGLILNFGTTEMQWELVHSSKSEFIGD